MSPEFLNPLIVAARWVHLTALVGLFGTLAFAVVLAPADVRPRLTRLAGAQLWIAAATATCWLGLEAISIADPQNASALFKALPTVITDTQFGKWLSLRLLLFGLLTFDFRFNGRRAQGIAVTLAAGALALQPLLGHAGAMNGSAGAGMVISEALHVLAVSVWVGGLFGLLLCLTTLSTAQSAEMCTRFMPFGLAAVLVIAGSGFVQGQILIGSLPGTVGTPYGRLALLKTALFAIALLLAALNRFVLTGRLTSTTATDARLRMFQSVTAETLVCVVTILTAAMLASQVPADHQQPIWPFAQRPSFDSLADPDLRQEVVVAICAILGAVGVVVISLATRRFRMVTSAVALVMIIWQGPALRLLLVGAYPTSCFHSPTGFSAVSIERGDQVFREHCVACHGPTGAGDGPLARGLRIAPADLTAPHLLEHSDGDLFWWISHGIDDPEGGMAMPGFAPALPERERWALIDFIRANNAGVQARLDGRWTQPVPVPSMPVHCASLDRDTTLELRGHVLVIVADPAPPITMPAASPSGRPVEVVHLRGTRTEGGCVVETDAAWPALSVLAGVSPNELTGKWFLVDAQGWLRGLYAAGNIKDIRLMIEQLRQPDAPPIATPAGGAHEHHIESP